MTNRESLLKAGFVVGNNIWDVPGERMYASGPGIMEVPAAMGDVIVTDGYISVVKPRWDNGKFVDLYIRVSVAAADEFLAWVAENGRMSEGGLPPFYNSWD